MTEFDHQTKQDNENEFCSVIVENTISVSCIYNPDGKPKHAVIEECRNICEKSIIVGDFNWHNEAWGDEITDRKWLELEKIIDDLELENANNHEPTYRVIRNGILIESVIDLAFLSTAAMAEFNNFEVLEDIGSDHPPCKVTLKGQTRDYATKDILLYHKADWEHLNKELLDEVSITNYQNITEIDQASENLEKALNKIKEQIPKKTIKIGRPSICKEIRNLIKEKRKIRRSYQRTRNPDHKTKLNKLILQIKKETKEAQNNEIQQKMENADPLKMEKTGKP